MHTGSIIVVVFCLVWGIYAKSLLGMDLHAPFDVVLCILQLREIRYFIKILLEELKFC